MLLAHAQARTKCACQISDKLSVWNPSQKPSLSVSCLSFRCSHAVRGGIVLRFIAVAKVQFKLVEVGCLAWYAWSSLDYSRLETCRGLIFLSFFLIRFLSFFVGFRRPNLITGLSGCRTPNWPLMTKETVPVDRSQPSFGKANATTHTTHISQHCTAISKVALKNWARWLRFLVFTFSQILCESLMWRFPPYPRSSR